jgi:ribonuclease J
MNFSKNELIFIPLGGSGEIGMNCNLYHYNGSWVMIDLGVMFGNSSMSPNELIMPDLSFLYENKIKLSALILTHAHEDHIGAVPYLYNQLNNVPIFTTSFTASVLKRKFISNDVKDFDIRFLDYNKQISIGEFVIEIFALTHSIPEPNAIILKTQKGNIFHTGDWKIDPEPLIGEPIDLEKLKKIKSDGIDAMICDSTNVFDENPSGSEKEVRDVFRKIFSEKKKGKIFVTCFASNIARLETVLKVSEELNKFCVFAGRSIHRIFESAVENNYLTNFKNIVSEKESRVISDDDLVIVCTGSQGEENAALSKLVGGKNNNIEIYKEDLIIFSSREIPGNEKKINSLKEKLLKKNCQYLDHRMSKVHVSGHPSKNELRKMYEWISPHTVIPVHGEYRHMVEQVNFAKKSGIKNQVLIQNGDVIKINKSNVNISSKVFSGRNMLKGKEIIPIDSAIFNRLKYVNSDGEFFVNLILDLDNKLLNEPIIFCPTVSEDEEFIEGIKKLLIDEINGYGKNFNDDNIISTELKKIIKKTINKLIGLKPLTYVEIVRI